MMHLKNTDLPEESKTVKKPFFFKNKFLLMGLSVFLVSLVIGILFFQTENLKISHSDYVFGIDVSHYQETINWDKVEKSRHPIEYIIVRATMGSNGEDSKFNRNWNKLKHKNYLKGAYHYYRPSENSSLQFENFSNTVVLKKGDLPPILDIERTSRFGDKNLRQGILNWLQLAESYYGVKPIIYTGRTFYKDHLEGYVEGYPLWIAAYSGKHRLNNIDWIFHQFTEKVRIKGIRGYVDGNDFNGSLVDLKNMCIK